MSVAQIHELWVVVVPRHSNLTCVWAQTKHIHIYAQWLNKVCESSWLMIWVLCYIKVHADCVRSSVHQGHKNYCIPQIQDQIELHILKCYTKVHKSNVEQYSLEHAIQIRSCLHVRQTVSESSSWTPESYFPSMAANLQTVLTNAPWRVWNVQHHCTYIRSCIPNLRYKYICLRKSCSIWSN